MFLNSLICSAIMLIIAAAFGQLTWGTFMLALSFPAAVLADRAMFGERL